MKPVTSREVAERAGVSRSTVSYVLGGRGDRFTEKTRSAVLRAVEELGYRPQPAGRALVTGRSDVVVVELARVLNGVLVDGLHDYGAAFAEAGLTALFHVGEATEPELTSLVSALRPRAYVAMRPIPREQSRLLSNAGVRPIFWDTLDFDRGLLRTQVGVLRDRGCQTIAYVRLVEAECDSFHVQRLAEFERLSRDEAGLGRTLTVSLHSDVGAQGLATLPAGTGLACYNDETAAIALRHLRAAGRAVPQDVAVVGADDAPIAALVVPAITTVAPVFTDVASARLLSHLAETDTTPLNVPLEASFTVSRRASA